MCKEKGRGFPRIQELEELKQLVFVQRKVSIMITERDS